MMARAVDPWSVLGVAPGSDLSTIKRAYKQLVFKYHSDKQEGDKDERALNHAREKFEEVRSAYEQIRAQLAEASPSASSSQSRTTAPSPTQRVKTVTISFVQAYEGVQLEVPIEANAACAHCGGSGSMNSGGGFCETCKGFGQRQVQGQLVQCDVCKGTGQALGPPCPFCDGNGYVKATRQYSVKIPAGVADGARLVAQPAHPGPAVEAAAVIVRVSESELYQRLDDPSDLMIDLPVTYREACLGEQVRVPTPEKVVSLQLPAGTSSGKTFRIAEHGMPKASQPGTRGDLYVRIQIAVPEKLSSSHRAAVEALEHYDEDPRRALYARA